MEKLLHHKPFYHIVWRVQAFPKTQICLLMIMHILDVSSSFLPFPVEGSKDNLVACNIQVEQLFSMAEDPHIWKYVQTIHNLELK